MKGKNEMISKDRLKDYILLSLSDHLQKFLYERDDDYIVTELRLEWAKNNELIAQHELHALVDYAFGYSNHDPMSSIERMSDEDEIVVSDHEMLEIEGVIEPEDEDEE